MILYYNKQTMKQTQTQSEDTIPMTDELMADYRHYAGNQSDKALELIQEVGQVPYLVYYKLDGEGNRYSHYLDEIVDGIYVPDMDKQAELEATQAREAFKAQRQEAVDNLEVTYEGTIYQGDEVSQGRMSRAILALPDDTTTTLWIAKDNTPMQLTKVDLSSILRLAGEAQTVLWIA